MIMPTIPLRITLCIIVASALLLAVTAVMALCVHFTAFVVLKNQWIMLSVMSGSLALWSYMVIWKTPTAVLSRWPYWLIYGYLFPTIGSPLTIILALMCYLNCA